MVSYLSWTIIFYVVPFTSMDRIITLYLVSCLCIHTSPRLVLRKQGVVIFAETVFQAVQDCK